MSKTVTKLSGAQEKALIAVVQGEGASSYRTMMALVKKGYLTVRQDGEFLYWETIPEAVNAYLVSIGAITETVAREWR